MRSRSFKPIKVGIEVYQFEVGHRKVWQVWFDGASASGYFRTEAEAREEAALVESEVRLGGVRHSKSPSQFRYHPAELIQTVHGKWRRAYLPMKRKNGEERYPEGDEDL